jgi:hypothetical protein
VKCHLFLKEGTGNIPNDGKFYLYHKGKLVQRFLSLKESQEAFEEIEKMYPVAKNNEPTAKITDTLRNQLRTVSNNPILKGTRQPFKNPTK